MSSSCVLNEDVSGDPTLTPGEAPVIMVSAPTAAVLGPVRTLRGPPDHVCSVCFLTGASVRCRDCHLIFGSAVLPSLCRAFFLQCSRNITWLPLSCSSAQAGVTCPRHPVWALRALRLVLSMVTCWEMQCPSELGMRASCLK